jgi:hypothetical protein
LNLQRPLQSRSTTRQSDRELKPLSSSMMSSGRIVELGHHVWPTSIEQQPPAAVNWSPHLDGSLSIAAHWTVRATRSKCPTPLIESSIAAVLHPPCALPLYEQLVWPCAVWNTPIAPPRGSSPWIWLWYHLLESKHGSDNPKSAKPNREITQTRTTPKHHVL